LDKSPDAFRTISEVADDLDVPQHVLRFWETRFTQIKPMKRSGGRRYYRPDDVDLLRGIRRLLYGEGYTIRGVQRILREQGIKAVQGLADAAVAAPSPASLAHRHDAAPEHDEVDAPDADIDFEDDGLVDVPAVPQRHHATRPPAVALEAAPRSGAVAPPRGGEAATGGTPALPAAAAAQLKRTLADLVACKKLVDEALKGGPPDIFALK
jgi:DNA-binding transcriptional MerR regulator